MGISVTLLLAMAFLLVAGVCATLLLRVAGHPVKLRWFLGGWSALLVCLALAFAWGLSQM